MRGPNKPKVLELVERQTHKTYGERKGGKQRIILPDIFYDKHKNKNMNKENKAMELFHYGYEDSVIAARTELSIEEVKDLRRGWEKCL